MSHLEVVDWRRRVFALYAEVRELAGAPGRSGDPAPAHAHWRAGRDALFATHPASPLLPEQRAGFAGLPVADYDPAWRFELPLLAADRALDERPEVFSFETSTDGTVHYLREGVVDVPGVGRLDVWRHTGYGGGLFLPIKDGLAGRPGGTYGGGRYLLDTIKGADLGGDAETGVLVIDLNFAYNPSCAYDPAWACPLAPAGDTTTAPIPVGETVAAGRAAA